MKNTRSGSGPARGKRVGDTARSPKRPVRRGQREDFVRHDGEDEAAPKARVRISRPRSDTSRSYTEEAKPRAAAPKARMKSSAAPRARMAGGERRITKAPVDESGHTKAERKAFAQETLVSGVQMLTVTADEAEMRLDRFLTARFPQLSFAHIQRIVRKGELRVDMKRFKSNDRLIEGQQVRIPPLKFEVQKPVARSASRDQDDRDFLRSITLYEDKDVLIINKPMGLAVQGGSGTTRHVDGILESLTDKNGEKPRLVHRLDKDTAGCLVIAKTRYAAQVLAKSFRSRSARKIYWAIVAGVPRVPQGRISTYLAREEVNADGDARMSVAKHGDDGASHALTYYALVDNAGQRLAWMSLKPVTGRTHQLRAHAAHIGHPIVGDPKYFNIQNWEFPGGIQNKLHLLARRIVIPHPRTGKALDVSAPLPPHMQQTFNLLGFDAARYDPIVDAPEE